MKFALKKSGCYYIGSYKAGIDRIRIWFLDSYKVAYLFHKLIAMRYALMKLELGCAN